MQDNEKLAQNFWFKLDFSNGKTFFLFIWQNSLIKWNLFNSEKTWTWLGCLQRVALSRFAGHSQLCQSTWDSLEGLCVPAVLSRVEDYWGIAEGHNWIHGLLSLSAPPDATETLIWTKWFREPMMACSHILLKFLFLFCVLIISLLN